MKLTKLKLARLLLAGAVVGVAIGNLLGVPLPNVGNVPPDLFSGAAGAAMTAVVFKLVHLV